VSVFDFSVIPAHFPQLLKGAGTTLLISLVAMVCGGILGHLICTIRVSQSRLARSVGRAYISFFRGTPLLVQLLVVFYVPSGFGVEMAPLPAALLGLTLNTAAFQAEIYRGGYASIPRGHVDAARVLGLMRWQIDFYILVPQVLRLTMPSLVNEAIDVLKSSALISVIAVTELLRVSQQLVAVTYRPLELYVVAAGFYLILTSCIAFFGHLAERRLRANF
jgi:polar amino acid transport system permease protein